MLKPKEQKLIKVKAPFIDEISSLAIIRILDGSTYSAMLLKLKFMCNAAMLDIVSNGPDPIIFKPEEMLGMRSSGYYKSKQGILQQNLRLMTHIEQIRGIFDVANSQRYRTGFAPMLFQWSHAHIARFFVAKNCAIKRGLERKNRAIKKSRYVCHGTKQILQI